MIHKSLKQSRPMEEKGLLRWSNRTEEFKYYSIETYTKTQLYCIQSDSWVTM